MRKVIKEERVMSKWNIGNIVGIIAVLVLGFEIVVLIREQQPPCTVEFKVIKGQNFNQPYPVYSSCSTGIYKTYVSK
jgi:hypothetical protein